MSRACLKAMGPTRAVTNSPITKGQWGKSGGGGPPCFPYMGNCVMPIGSRHTITGTIGPGRFGWVLNVNGGGQWELEAGFFTLRRIRRLAGRQVVIEGERSGFNLLWVKSIRPCASAPV